MLLSFPREIGLRRHLCHNKKDMTDYIKNVNGKASCYTSLYSFENIHPNKKWKVDIDSVVIDRAWWDFDTTEDYDIVQVKKDVAQLLSKLTGDVRVVATGRGFHVHQLFDKSVRGTAIARHLDRYQRIMAQGLKTLDGVGNPQKLTRIANTYNVTRKRWSVNIDTRKFMQNPLGYKIPNSPTKELRKYDPFFGMNNQSDFSLPVWIASNPHKEDTILIKADNITVGCAGDVPLPTCLERAIKTENPRHEVRVALAQHLSQNLRWCADKNTLDYTQKQDIINTILNFIRKLNWRDFNENISLENITYMVDTYNNCPTPHWYISKGYCSGKDCWYCE